MKPAPGNPESLTVHDIFCFGAPLKASCKRRKKDTSEIVSWDWFHPGQYWTAEQIDEWTRVRRHQVMFRDESNVD